MAPDITNINGVEMADIASINGQDAPSGSGTATTAPSVSVSGGLFGIVTVTITKSGGGTYTNPNYQVISTLADGTVTVTDANVDRSLESDESHLSGVLTLTDTNASTAERTVTVKAQEFGDTIQSNAATGTYTPAFIQNQYVRIRGVTSDGSDTSNRIAIDDINFYTGSGQSGTVYPTSNLTANDSETGIAVSQGHVFSSTYAAFKAVDSDTSNTMAWLLATSAANNYWQIEFETGTYSSAPVIKSIDIRFDGQNDATHFAITGSDNADHSSATVYAVYEISAENTVLNFG